MPVYPSCFAADSLFVSRCYYSSFLFQTLPSVSALAFAQICKRDQNGRPIASYLNVCPDKISQVSQLKLRDVSMK